MITYQDLTDHLTDYSGADPSAEGTRYARRAAETAYREVTNLRHWHYYLRLAAVSTVAPYNTGTIAYTESTRTMTLTGGTWPTWIIYGKVRIVNAFFLVESQTSSTVIVLSASTTPGKDLAAGTVYTSYRDLYPMPTDFVSAGDIINTTQVLSLRHSHPDQLLTLSRTAQGPAQPYRYAFVADGQFPGRIMLWLYPAPDNIYSLEFIYQKQARALVFQEYTTGTAAVTAASTTVTGTGTAWISSMVGSIIRLAAVSTDPIPSGLYGGDPYLYERTISAVASGTSLTVNAAIPTALSAVKYRISDPVDIEEGSLSTFLLRECEKQFRLLRRIRSAPEEVLAYNETRRQALEQDSRSFQAAWGGQPGVYRPRYIDMPRGTDQGV